MAVPLKLSNIRVARDKTNKLQESFLSTYGTLPEFYAQAPGRVNLIGEHIDYCNYAVFPIAIQQNILIAVAKRNDEKICVTNIDSQYEKFECNINTFKIHEIKQKWYKYVLCGIQGIKDEVGTEIKLPGLSLTVFGDIPRAAGLSSSSALVCAAGLALSHCLKMEVTLSKLATLFAKAERYIGTQGGGMDQAASILSNAGSAQLIEFEPLRCTPVALPVGANFVVVNSMVEKEKAATSDFNTRVIECKLACRILAQKCNVSLDGEKIVLGVLQKKLDRSFSQMVELVKEFLHSQPYSKQEICQILHLSSDQLDEDVLSPNTRHVTEYQLYKRALHVFTEASRVWEYKNICDEWHKAHSSDRDSSKALRQLGELMQESHASAHLLYECSHPKLDKLVTMSKGITYGARLTGAGWGGCIVALLDKSKTKDYIDLIKREYFIAEDIKIEEWDSVIFTTEPADGACVFVPE